MQNDLFEAITETSEPAVLPTDGGRRARLIAVSPSYLPTRIHGLSDGVAVVGRTPAMGASIVLPHSTVSRRHAELHGEGDHHVVRDAGSHNGTRVNGAWLERGEARLRDGDVLRFGDVVAVYETVAAESGGVVGANRVDADAIPGISWKAERLRVAVAAAAEDLSPALIVGETGTGKEFIARELHRLSGRSGAFVEVNCGALSPQLVESLLFGHEAGAFTGAQRASAGLFRQAEGGTLLLDEIGELDVNLQPKLLRVLQERRIRPVGSQREVDVDVRVIAATHRDLVQMVEDGVFRRDLWARLSLLEIDVPPLRERRADLLSWLGRLVGRWSSERESSPTVLDVPADTVEAALLLPWTENLRGLDRVLRRHLVHGSPRGVLRVEDLDAGDSAAPSPAPADPAPTLRETRPLVRVPTRSPSSVGVVMANGADVGDAAAAASARPRSLTTTDSWGRKPPPDRDTLVAILRSRGSIRGAASALERDRRQIYRWIEAYGVEPDEWRAE